MITKEQTQKLFSVQRLWVKNQLADKHFAKKCLADRLLVNRHLADKHLADRCLAKRLLFNRHCPADILPTYNWPTYI
jgi:hypothetical protein